MKTAKDRDRIRGKAVAKRNRRLAVRFDDWVKSPPKPTPKQKPGSQQKARCE